MKKFNNKDKGITLIALVITIIVLLILAGVSISMLSGDNTILKQAADAKDITEETTDLEMIKIAIQSALVDGLGTLDITDTTGTTKGSLKKELDSAGITGYEGNGILEYNDKIYAISKDGKVGVKKFTAENYGDSVNYNGSTDWQILFDDGINVYLISKNYIDWGTATTNAAGMDTDKYAAYWTTEPSLGKKTVGENCVESLLKKEYWTAYKDSEGKAEYAIGAPTLDMWVSSWNEKGIIDSSAYPKIFLEDRALGKYIGLSNDTIDVYVSLKSYGTEANENGYYDTLYFNTSNEDAQGYWIASVNPGDARTLRMVHWFGSILNSNYDTSSMAVRPVVCLNSKAQFEKNGDVWDITLE